MSAAGFIKRISIIARVRAALPLNAQTLVLSNALALLIAFVCFTEKNRLGMCLVVAFFFFLFSLFRLLWLGPILSVLLSFSTIFGIYGASKFTFWLMARRLHPFDVYNYVNFDNFLYVKHLYPKHYLFLYVGLALFLLLVIAVLWLEKLNKPSRINAAAFLFILLSFASLPYGLRYLEGGGSSGGNRFLRYPYDELRTLHYDEQHTSTFILSAIHSLPELVAGRMFEYGDKIQLDPQQVAAARNNGCLLSSDANSPNVIVILRESIVIPSTVEGMGVPQIDESRFRSSDGRSYRLRVETFGGGSAHAIFSLLTGLSAESFGAMKSLAIDLTPGNLHYSLPLLMRDCGYRTIAITTGTHGYVASERFFRSVGFQDYFEWNKIFGRTGDVSDRGIYRFLSEVIESKDEGRPIFAYVDTLASHAPYTYALRPKETVPEAAQIKNPIIAEYIRRLIIGERDLQNFIEHYRKSGVREGRPLVVLDFGDHQPNFTRDLPGHPGYVIEDRDQDDPHMFTYFRIRSTGRALAELPSDHPIVDVAFMSDWLVHALDLPVKGVYKIRWSMAERCKSRYWQCENHAAAHELHQLLRAAGLISYP
jgi:phosphoglycerol transferase MdoB-like AlkP superfamily enzyme